MCNGGDTIVVSADRMVTVPGLSLEVERQRSKIAHVSNNQLVMSSGDGLLCSEILHDLRKTYAPSEPSDVDESADRFLGTYVALRIRRLEEMFTRPIGYDFGRFMTDGLKNMGPQLHLNVVQQMGQFNLGADFIFVEFAAQQARVALIAHPGTLRWLDSQEFYAIGSGSSHAVSSLLLSDHTIKCSCEQAVLNVYTAKRMAQRAPGVGVTTDLQIVTRVGIKSLGDESFKILDELHKTQTDRASVSKDDFGKLKESIDASKS